MQESAEQLIQPFASLSEAMDHASARAKDSLTRIQASASGEMQRIFQIEERVKKGEPLPRVTKAYLDLGIRRILSNTGDLFHLVGYVPEKQTKKVEEKTESEIAQGRAYSTARRLVGETLPETTLALIRFCRQEKIPFTDVTAVFDHFGLIEKEHFVDGIKYRTLPKEEVGELLSRAWGEIAEVFVLLSASKRKDDWQCYLTAQKQAEAIAQSVAEVATQSESLPAFLCGAYGILTDLIEERHQDFSQLIVSSLPPHLKETQKILSLLAMGVKGVIEPTKETAAAVKEGEQKYLCLSNLADFESIKGLIDVLGGKPAEDTIYYIDPNHLDELNLRRIEYKLRWEREPLVLITAEAGRYQSKWPPLISEITKASELEREVRSRLRKMRTSEETFMALTGIMNKRISLYKEMVQSTPEMPVTPQEFLNYHWDTFVFLSNVAGHSMDSAQAMENLGRFIKGEGRMKETDFTKARKHFVKMAGYFAPDRFFAGEEVPESIEDFHNVLIGLRDLLDLEILRHSRSELN